VLSLSPPKTKDGEKVRKGDREESWHSRGWDYGANFTINICAPVIEELDDVVGIEKERRQNVSAYYTMDGKTYSIGYVTASNPRCALHLSLAIL
jgi:cation-dependent mannose-6-phosphate receptor